MLMLDFFLDLLLQLRCAVLCVVDSVSLKSSFDLFVCSVLFAVLALLSVALALSSQVCFPLLRNNWEENTLQQLHP